MDSHPGLAVGDAGVVGPLRGWAGPWDARRAGLGSARVPCTAALAPCLLAAVPLARSPRRGWDFGASRRDVPRQLGPLQRGPRLRAGVVRRATFT